MTETTILAYRLTLQGDTRSWSEWYCPACWADLDDVERELGVAITDADDLPDDGPSHGHYRQARECDGDCGRYLHTGKTLAEMAAW